MKALAVTASILVLALVLVVAALSLFPGTDPGEPVAIFDIQRTKAPAAVQAPAQAPAAGTAGSVEGKPPGRAEAPGEFQLPPGFAVTPVPPGGAGGQQQSAPASQQQPGVTPQQQPPTPQQQSAPAPLQQENVPATDTGAPGASAPPANTPVETGSISLTPVPVAELVEESQYGPLPKIAADGRRPLEVYARPSSHAAGEASGGPARVAVLVSGMGVPESATEEAIKTLPATVSVAYGAYGRSLQDWVGKAREAGHEVFLEIPLEPNNYPEKDPGPHTLLTSLPAEENMKRLQWLMSRFTGYVGVTNHMGEKFQAAQESVQPVLMEIKQRGLLYLDDGAADGSAARQVASAVGLEYAVANVQIDAASSAEVAKSLAQLEALAKERGIAIGVVAAKPETVKQLAAWAEQLQSKGIVLVPVSAAMRSQRQS